MFPFMVDNGKKGSGALFYDFEHARELILARDAGETARLAGIHFDAANSEFKFKSLGQEITVSYPECRARLTQTGKTPVLDWHLSILHHLSAANGATLSGRWAPIRDIGEHMSHPQAFESQTNNDLVKNLAGQPLENIRAAATALGADIQKANADLQALFHLFPRFPILVQLWLNDEELPGSGKVLFDAYGTHYLEQGDVYHSGVLLVEFFIAQYKLMFS